MCLFSFLRVPFAQKAGNQQQKSGVRKMLGDQ
jgi:hypothetical protein